MVSITFGHQLAQAAGSSCKTRYPIVLSHHWGARRICNADQLPAGRTCEQIEQAKNCRSWVGAQCMLWEVPPDEADLPPRDTNLSNPALVRNMKAYHRYFSKEIVDRLRNSFAQNGCGNAVYIADKPVLASYDVRARVLRETVLQALRETGAAKVNIIGMSQGVQDARYMTAALPVDERNPALGQMRDKVASIVSVVGEDAGAQSSGLLLDTFYALNQGQWNNPQALGSQWKESEVDAMLWRDKRVSSPKYVLSEVGYADSDAGLTSMGKYQSWLRSMVELSNRYMKPGFWQQLSFEQNWAALRAAAGMSDLQWSDKVPDSAEANNGVYYASYAAHIRNPVPEWGNEAYIYALLQTRYGDNDSMVTVSSQSFAGKGGWNFHHIKTMNGSVLGRGYHHMFFSGRNDALYAPEAGYREVWPYNGSSADFYEVVASNLKLNGF
ncbi:MAG: hypothetical protein KGL90_03650 [Burkholderiales bacterium]|nr:hypothetical protein [Burkholderiales bacterium]